jgi:hypothetical protein
MKDIPIQRLIGYFLVLSLLPLFLVGFHLSTQLKQIREAREGLFRAQQRIISQQQRGMSNRITRVKYADTDHYYIARYVEPFSLLRQEIAALHALVEHEPSLPDKEVICRYEMLTGGSNQLSFTESSVHTAVDMRETVETLNHPVEIDQNDLVNLLALIEGVEIGEARSQAARPHLLIADFSLTRKGAGDANELFLLDMKLLKREYLK